ncbi:amino acid ABC transporter permease [Yoonia sp. MH D7]
MSTLTDPPKPPFRLSQLLYDTRYRSITIQIVAIILIAVGIWWLATNTIANLNALGKDFDFGFLGTAAGYDINQTLIPYNNQMTHGRAALVGILNTLLVAFLGCVAATIIGVIVGVLRLSKNWIVSRLMSVYVEGFRNVPLLLWIILIGSIMTEAMPQPNAFRGENATASMIANDSVAITGRGIYIPRIGFTNSLSGNEAVAPREGYVAVASGGIDWLLVFGALALGLIGIRYLRARASRIQQSSGVRPTTWHMQLGLLIIPVGIVFVLLGATVVQPFLKGFNFTEGTFLRNSLIALWFALSLYTGAFIAETVRAGILSVSKGQSEAAAALGISPRRTMSLVILPQAMRVIIPPLISQFLNLTKNSSLALAVGYMDIRATLGGITLSQTGRELEGMLLLGLFYLTISLIISAVMNFYNSSMKLKER